MKKRNRELQSSPSRQLFGMDKRHIKNILSTSYHSTPVTAWQVVLHLLFAVSFFYPRKTAAQTFQEISAQVGINTYCLDRHDMGGGVVLFDYNQDNYTDLFILGGEAPSALYRNNWDGTFSNVSAAAGLTLSSITTVGAAVGDIDNDGDEDLFVSTGRDQANVLLRNNGDGTFSDISEAAGILETAWSTSVSFGDFNLDGLIDIYVNNYAIYESEPFAQNIRGGYANFLYQNLGNNQFVNVAEDLQVADAGCGLAVTFSDCDGDNDPDLYVANDFGLSFEPNELYLNQYPENTFRSSGRITGVNVKINAMGVAIGDYDEDGDFDYYVTNIADNPFFENKGQGRFFEDLGISKGISNPDGTSWGAAFLDYNNDSYLDLVVANGAVIEAPHQNDENRLFQGNQEFEFEDISKAAGIASDERCRGLSFADIDNDGDLDLLFGVVSKERKTEQNALLYRNNNDQNNWFKVKLQGTNSNRNGYGSKIKLVVGSRSLFREADGGSSYLSHSLNEIHFGLGTQSIVDSLIVTWPGGYQDIYTQLKANTAITILEGSHWFRYSNEEISIFKGDSIFLAGAFRSEAGIYHHYLSDSRGVDTSLIITKLNLLDPPVEPVEQLRLIAAPNPFLSWTELQYQLPEDGQVQLSLFDISGKLIKVLVDEQQSAGTYFLPMEEPLLSSSSGLYFFRLQLNDAEYIFKVLKVN